jgi:hypothetical protein
MEYTLSGKVVLDDFIQFVNFCMKPNRRIILHSFLISASIILLLAFSIKSFIIKTFIPSDLIMTILPLLSLITMPFGKKGYYKANVSRRIQHIKINEEAILFTADDGSKTIFRPKKIKIKYDEDSIYIYQTLTIPKIIKKRFMKNENDFDELVNFVKKHYT